MANIPFIISPLDIGKEFQKENAGFDDKIRFTAEIEGRTHLKEVINALWEALSLNDKMDILEKAGYNFDEYRYPDRE